MLLNLILTAAVALGSGTALKNGPAYDCSGFTKEKTAAIAVGFSYPKTRSELFKTTADSEFYHDKIGHALSETPKKFSDSSIAGKTKDQFLAMLSADLKGKKAVFFSYSGHGVRWKGRGWGMLLPGAPEWLTNDCNEEFSSYNSTYYDRVHKNRRPDSVCRAEAAKYIVTDEELRKIFGDRDVVVMNDSCFSGAADFGPKAVTISASFANQPAEEVLSIDSMKLSRFTTRMNERFDECAIDSDKDGRLNAAEFTTRFAFAKTGTDGENYRPQPKTVTIRQSRWAREQRETERAKASPKGATSLVPYVAPSTETRQQATINGSKPWLQCLNFGELRCVHPKNEADVDAESHDGIE